MRRELAVYIHIPWCASLCPYCDFAKQAHDFRLVDQYIAALSAHIEATPARAVHSIYFGGGTPSLLTAPRLRWILDACRAHFSVLAGAEISVEANPSDVVEHKMAAYLEAGVTRLSIGIQSLVDAELRFLGRRHTADKARRAVQAARAAGCRDLSVDLMYGLPAQSPAAVRRSIEGLIGLGPNHVSCYALTIEPHTPFAGAVAAGRLAPADEDAVADQYALIQELLSAAGFEQYELSNWARAGHMSVHNLTYWRNGEWAGIGAGAAGSIAGVRYQRSPVVRDYIAGALSGEPCYVDFEHWTAEQRMRDTIMLGLRLSEGVSDAAFRAEFGLGINDFCTERLAEIVGRGLLRWRDDRLSLDSGSYLVCNAVLAEILPPQTL